MRLVSSIVVAAILFSTFCPPLFYFSFELDYRPQNEETYFGVTFGGNTTSEAKLLIDKVKGYTNLFVVDNWDISLNETALTEICDYAVDANLNIMVYFDFVFFNQTYLLNSRWRDLFIEAGIDPFHTPWLASASDRWGEKFLGAYVLDEPGSKQLDIGHYGGFATGYRGNALTTFDDVSTYSDAARRFVRGINRYYVRRLNNISYSGSIPNATGKIVPVFTADNALYWFDYLAGYNAVFAEFGWNHNEAQHIALCRGAANVQDKEWGTIITWATNDPPYLASGSQMIQQLNIAYYSGAKYLLVFNYPQINPYGALTEEHFTAMEHFWNRINSFPGNILGKVEGEVALVLPKDYGWGMRQADDKIWGIWPADDLSPLIGEKIATMINKYGLRLDIIYDDPQFNYTEKYSEIHYWNSSTPLFTSSMPVFTQTNELYATLLGANITMICIPFYILTKRKRQKKPELVVADSTSKTGPTNFGRGKLELVGNTIRFHKQIGYLRKRKEIVREIPLADVESITNIGKEVSIKWRGVTETFIVEEIDLVGKIQERIAKIAEEQRILQDKEVAKQERDEIAKTINISLEITDLLFDILRNLHGKVDWNRIESYSKLTKEKGKKLPSPKDWALGLNFDKLLLAVKDRNPKEMSNETFIVLRTLYDYFRGLTSKNEFLDEIHPNVHDAKTTISAYYALNDVMLGSIVGDEENGGELSELTTRLDDLSKRTDLEININEFEGVIKKLGARKENESAIKEGRIVFRRQLKSIIADFETA